VVCTWSGTLDPCQELFLAHRLHFSHCLTYARELGDIEVLGQGGLEGHAPSRMGSFDFSLHLEVTATILQVSSRQGLSHMG
jgi:hypothetical protein